MDRSAYPRPTRRAKYRLPDRSRLCPLAPALLEQVVPCHSRLPARASPLLFVFVLGTRGRRATRSVVAPVRITYAQVEEHLVPKNLSDRAGFGADTLDHVAARPIRSFCDSVSTKIVQYRRKTLARRRSSIACAGKGPRRQFPGNTRSTHGRAMVGRDTLVDSGMPGRIAPGLRSGDGADVLRGGDLRAPEQWSWSSTPEISRAISCSGERLASSPGCRRAQRWTLRSSGACASEPALEHLGARGAVVARRAVGLTRFGALARYCTRGPAPASRARSHWCEPPICRGAAFFGRRRRRGRQRGRRIGRR